jgi:hypothetical protein
MPIEYRQPIESEYDSPTEYATALLDSVREYKQAMFKAIDRSAVRGNNTIRVEAAKPTARYARDITIHDYLATHPALLKRYREIGPLALLELN